MDEHSMISAGKVRIGNAITPLGSNPTEIIAPGFTVNDSNLGCPTVRSAMTVDRMPATNSRQDINSMQLDIFEHSRDVALRNSVIDAGSITSLLRPERLVTPRHL